MSFQRLRPWVSLPICWLAALVPGVSTAQEPDWLILEPAEGESAIRQVFQEAPLEPSAPPAPFTPPPTAPTTTPVTASPADSQSTSLLPSIFGPSATGRSGMPRFSTDVIPRSESVFRQTTDAGDPIGKSPLVRGATTQKRSPIINAPLIRGKNAGDLLASGSYWFPARQDLDTLLNKIDSRLLSDLSIIKGPYTSRIGPGFSFIDARLLGAPRYAGGYEVHGATSFDYRSNGDQFYGRQSLWGGDEHWGYRIGYGHRGGSDYESGNGTEIPSSYKWRDVDVALGYDHSPTQHLDVHFLRLDQTDVEFPGQAFDMDFLVTDAVDIRWVDTDPGFSDLFEAEVWYNRTRFEGNSQGSGKRRQNPVLDNFGFFGLTSADLMSTGFSLASTWGDPNEPQTTFGTDLRYLKQEIEEFNSFRARSFNPVAAAVDPTFDPTGIPAAFPIVLGQPPIASRPIYNTDFIFPFFQPDIPKLVPRSHSSNPGLFVEHQRPIGDRLRIKAGARADWVSTNVEETGSFTPYDFTGLFIIQDEILNRPQPIIPFVQRAPVNVREALGERHYTLGSFYLTGEYDLDENWIASAGVGHAMRPPTLTELYSFNGPFLAILQRGGNFVFGNPDLSASRLWQVDAGLTANYGRFRGGVNGYYSWILDHVTLRPLLPLQFISIETEAVQPVQFTNTDLATIFGGELFAEYDITPHLTAFAVSSYVRGTDQNRDESGRLPNLIFPTTNRIPGIDVPTIDDLQTPDTEPLPGIPPWDNRLGLRLHEGGRMPRWGVEVSTRIVDNQHRVAQTLREAPTPGFTVWDLRSFWQVNKHWLLLGAVENFTDKQYREHIDLRTGVFQPGVSFNFGTQLVY